jgi:PAS domain S-box-containing protein
VAGIGSYLFHDLHRSQSSARVSYARVLQGLELLSELQYQTQEARRTLLYTLVTSYSSREVEVASLSGAADEKVARLLKDNRPFANAVLESQATKKLAQDWQAYLRLRDELVASMVKGRPMKSVERDLKESEPAFLVVRDDLKELETLLKAEGERLLKQIQRSFLRSLLNTGTALALMMCCAFIGVKILQKNELLGLAKSAEAQLRQDLESITEELLVLDADQRVQQWNEAAEKSWSRLRDAMLGQPVARAFPEIASTPLAPAIQAALQTGKASVLSDLRLQAAGGERFYQARVFPFQNRATVFLDNITEARQAEASKARLSAILEATTDFVGMADAAGHVLYINRAGRRMVGISEDEDVRATKIPDYHPEWASRLVLTMGLPAAARDGFWAGETALRTRDGRELPISQVLLSHKRADGTVEYYSTIARDVTERKEAEVELVAANQQLIEISRHAGMAEAATSVLHNVGNVLNSVNVSAAVVCDRLAKSRVMLLRKSVALLQQNRANLPAFLTTNPKGQALPGFLENLAGHLEEENAGMRKEMEDLAHHVEHIKQIVSAQQSYGRVFGVIESLDPRVVIEDALRLNAESLDCHHITIERDYATERPVTVERHKLLQILVNLLRNAAQAIIEANPPERRITIRLTDKAPDRLAITVTDTGVGIPEENQTRIFSHGFTTKKDGHGFGLHASVLSAREMNGDLTVHSDGPSRGAAFTLDLPTPFQP